MMEETWEKLAGRIEAECAAMREALEAQRDLWEQALNTLDELEQGTARIPFSELHKPMEQIDAALSGDAGRELSERLHAAEKGWHECSESLIHAANCVEKQKVKLKRAESVVEAARPFLLGGMTVIEVLDEATGEREQSIVERDCTELERAIDAYDAAKEGDDGE